jgi:hypothetical protein
MLNEKKLTSAELAAREKIIMGMKKNKSKLVKKFGKDAEKVMYGRATNIAKQQAEVLQKSEDMKEDRLRKMIQDALMTKQSLKEDDWEQKDDESNMALSQLSSIIELSNNLKSLISDEDQLDAWVQSKLTKAQDYLNSVYGYLKGEEKQENSSPQMTAIAERILNRLKNNI